MARTDAKPKPKTKKDKAAKPTDGVVANDGHPPQPAATAETPTLQWRISQAAYDARVERVRQELAARQLDALVLFHPIRMAYVSGFYHLSTERPMAIVVPLETDAGLGALIPLLEREHLAKAPSVTRAKVYPEYPSGGTKHPLRHLADLLAELKLDRPGARIGYDSDGYLDINGYDGPTLSEVVPPGVETFRARDLVDRLRHVKSEAELGFIRESCVWGNLAHRLMQQRLELGRTEMEISLEASLDASKTMIAALGPGYQPLTMAWGGMPAQATFHAGANTALPHGLANAVGLRRGDVLVTYAGADVGGYNSELERTMILGEPTPEFARHFDLMLQLQQVGFDALRPGRTLAEAETDVANAFAELGVVDMQRHHTGHGLGLEGHEAPFIDKGDETVIRENMVFSVEPGLYVPGLAGFRHSDAVVVRADGAERLTYYPRDLESMIVPV
ncbi:MAG: Xaa-Pro peptidase family protein [Chloroflexota bacterium]|nr:Xaa-Pro peptidase family protein [Chloroflexota bacterium]